MLNKCIVKDCKSNYASQRAKGLPQVPVNRFPSAKKESEMRKNDAVMNHYKELVVTEYRVVCAKHWPFLLALKSTARMVVKNQQNLLLYLVTFQSQTSYLLSEVRNYVG